MTLGKPICPACGGETFKEGMHCPACLEAYMKTMTPADWQRALSEVMDEAVRSNGETARTD